MTQNPIKPVADEEAANLPRRRKTLPRRRARRSAWMRGEETQEGVGSFNRCPPGHRPRFERFAE